MWMCDVRICTETQAPGTNWQLYCIWTRLNLDDLDDIRIIFSDSPSLIHIIYLFTSIQFSVAFPRSFYRPSFPSVSLSSVWTGTVQSVQWRATHRMRDSSVSAVTCYAPDDWSLIHGLCKNLCVTREDQILHPPMSCGCQGVGGGGSFPGVGATAVWVWLFTSI
jgi:hypothetical protein